MNFKEIVERVIIKLREADMHFEAENISELLSIAYTTQTEYVGSITKELIDMVKYDSDLQKLIGKEVQEAKIYSQFLGLKIQ